MIIQAELMNFNEKAFHFENLGVRCGEWRGEFVKHYQYKLLNQRVVLILLIIKYYWVSIMFGYPFIQMFTIPYAYYNVKILEIG